MEGATKQVTLTFTLPEEQEVAEMAFYATELFSVIHSLGNWLHKAGDADESPNVLQVHKKLWDLIDENRVSHLFK